MNETKLQGDELKLRRMLWNIVDNGIKYTQAGGTVDISSVLDNGNVRIDVRDTASELHKKILKYIFDRFYRADGSRNRETEVAWAFHQQVDCGGPQGLDRSLKRFFLGHHLLD